MEEEELEAVLEFISGKGRFSFLGGGVSTYPNREDGEHGLHLACLELERRGLICRRQDDGDHILWMPVEK